MSRILVVEQEASLRRLYKKELAREGDIVLDEKTIPDVGPLDALVRISTTTICGTDIHILEGEYPVKRGLTIGHEPVGVIEKLGAAVTGFKECQRVIAGAITPSGHSAACLSGCFSQDGAGTKHGFKAIGLCATAGAKLCGATTIITVPSRACLPAGRSRSGWEPITWSTSGRSIPSRRSCA